MGVSGLQEPAEADLYPACRPDTRKGLSPLHGLPCGPTNGQWKDGRYSRASAAEQRQAPWNDRLDGCAQDVDQHKAKDKGVTGKAEHGGGSQISKGVAASVRAT